MREAIGDLFAYPADAVVIPVNWTTKRNGDAVMGADVAKQAATRWPGLLAGLASAIAYDPDLPHVTHHRYRSGPSEPNVVAYPTKREWWKPSEIGLIDEMAPQLVRLADHYDWQTVALPRVGCGLGGLDWADVKPILERHLDDRFVVLTPAAS